MAAARSVMPGAAPESMPSAPRGFPADERRLLLSLPRIGPTVVARIEAQGIASLRDLQNRGVERVVDEVCRRIRTRAWANRRSALAGALDALVRGAPAEPTAQPTPATASKRPQRP
jgi:hypothetical protein